MMICITFEIFDDTFVPSISFPLRYVKRIPTLMG